MQLITLTDNKGCEYVLVSRKWKIEITEDIGMRQFLHACRSNAITYGLGIIKPKPRNPFSKDGC